MNTNKLAKNNNLIKKVLLSLTFIILSIITFVGFGGIQKTFVKAETNLDITIDNASTSGGYLRSDWFVLTGLTKANISQIHLQKTVPATYTKTVSVAAKNAAGDQYDGSTTDVVAYINGSVIYIVCPQTIYAPQQCDSLFAEFNNATTIGLSNFNTSTAVDMNCMFANNMRLTSLDVSGFDTFGVHNMSSMFYHCLKLKTINVSNFSTSLVTNFNSMFYKCQDLETLDVSGFDTKNARDMGAMFYNCTNTVLDVSGFDTSQVTNMREMFSYCWAKELDVSNFNTQNVTSMKAMFQSCNQLSSLDLSNFNTNNVTSMGEMFKGCSGLTSLNLSNFNVSKVSSFNEFFANCKKLQNLDISNFNTSSANNMNMMFYECDALKSLDISHFNMLSVKDAVMMFGYCDNLENLNISGLKTPRLESAGSMFMNCPKLTSLDLSGFDVSKVDNLQNMFAGCSSISYLDLSNFKISTQTKTQGLIGGMTSLVEIKTPAKVSSLEKFYITLPGSFFNKATGDGPYDKITDSLTSITLIKGYKIYYELNNGIVEGSNISGYISKNESQTISLTQPTKRGATFKSWTITTNTAKEAVIANNILSIPANAKGDLYIRADYENIIYDVIQDTNGGSTATVLNYSINNYQEQKLTLVEPVKINAIFQNWEIIQNTTPESSIDGLILTIPADAIGNVKLEANYFNEETFIITIDLNGGITQDNQTTINYISSLNSQTIALQQPTKKGYDFIGWTIQTNTTTESSINNNILTIPAMATGNITIKANFSIIYYQIIFNCDGGTGVENSTYSISDSNRNFTLTIPIKNGYTLTNWVFETNTDIVSIVENNILTIPANAIGNITLKAVYKLNQYTISFNTDGGNTIQDISYSYNQNEQKFPLQTPTKNSNIFDYWEIIKNSIPAATIENELLIIPAKAQGDIQLKAIYFTYSTYTITLDTNGGQTQENITQIQYNNSRTEQVIILPDITKQNADFEYWEIVVDANRKCTVENNVLTIPIMASGDITLKAIFFEYKEYTITLNVNGGELQQNILKYTSSKNSQTVELPEPTKNSCWFAGWIITVNTEIKTIIEDNILKIPARAIGDIELSADWIKYITVTFDVGTKDDLGKELSNEPQIETQIKQYELGEIYNEFPTPTLNGYNFEGWYLDKEFTQKIEISDIVENENDFTVYAKWTKINSINWWIIILIIIISLAYIVTVYVFAFKK